MGIVGEGEGDDLTIEPGHYDITIFRGATYDQTFTWLDDDASPIDLTGFTARMHVRDTVDAPDPPLLSLTTPGDITLGGGSGTIRVIISAAATSALAFTKGVYDLELVDGAVVTRLLQGAVKLSREVTR